MSRPASVVVAFVALLGLLVTASGCASNSTSPSPQTPPPPPAAAPQVVTVTVDGPAAVVEGQSATFTATAIYSDGSRQAAPAPVWTAEGVAAVNASGVVEGVQPGTATITARVNDVRGTRDLRVLPLMSGAWRGRWRHLGCRPVDPPQAGACASIIPGSTSAIAIDLRQDNRSLEGTVNYSGALMTVTGQVADDGVVTLTGRRVPDYEIVTWSTSVIDRVLTGTFSLRQTRIGGFPLHVIDDELVDVRKAQ